MGHRERMHDTWGGGGGPGDDRHAAAVAGEVHDVEDLEGGLNPQHLYLDPVLRAVHELEAQLPPTLHQRHLVWGGTLHRGGGQMRLISSPKHIFVDTYRVLAGVCVDIDYFLPHKCLIVLLSPPIFLPLLFSFYL